MKKFIVGLAVLPAFATMAADMTPYLLINKEYRHIDQDNSERSMTGVTDVDGFESRIGMKASQKLDNGLTANAKVELGVNSQRDGGNGDRIRIRLAQAGLSGGFGSITVGQHWNPNTLRMLSLDPFTATGAQLLGLESGDSINAVSGNFGMRARYFQDGITYKTKNMGGFAVSVTVDNAADDLANDADGSSKEWTTVVASYDKNMGNLTLNAHVTHAMGQIENSGDVKAGEEDQEFTTVGLKLSNKAWGVSAAYTTDDQGNKDERTHMLAAAWYNMGKTTLGLNYGMTEFDMKSILGGAAAKGGEQSQIAAGAIYKLAKNVKTRLIYRLQKLESGATGVAENKTKAIITGLTVGF